MKNAECYCNQGMNTVRFVVMTVVDTALYTDRFANNYKMAFSYLHQSNHPAVYQCDQRYSKCEILNILN